MSLTKSRASISRKQRGYSMVELSVALAIVSVILVGGLMGARQVLSSVAINNQIKESAMTISKAQRYYSGQSSTSKATTDVMASLGIWPATRTSSTGSPPTWTVNAVVNGAFERMFNNPNAYGSLASNKGFVYTLRQIPKANCAELVSAMDNLAHAIYVAPGNSTAPTSGALPTGNVVVKSPDAESLDVSKLGTACTPATGNTVDVVLVLRV